MRPSRKATPPTSSRTFKSRGSLRTRRSTADPDLNQAYFYLGNWYDNLFKPSRRGEPENDALPHEGRRRTTVFAIKKI